MNPPSPSSHGNNWGRRRLGSSMHAERCPGGGGLSRPGGRNGGAALGWPHIPLSKSLPLTAIPGLLLGSALAWAEAQSRHLYACLAHCGNPCTQLLGGSQLVFVSCLLPLLPHLPTSPT